MGSGVDALVQAAEKACDLARANWRTSDLRGGSTAKLRVFALAKMASSQAVPRAMAWHEPHALFFL
jgi:hypothetical protein